MRMQAKVMGFNNDIKTMTMKQEMLIVNVTKDSIGCTVSISSEKDGKQFTIPFDEILKELNRK